MPTPEVEAVGLPTREQSWSEDTHEHGRIFVVTDNPVSRALEELAEVLGRRLTVVAEVTVLADLEYAQLTERDAVVLADHDAPGVDAILDLVLHSSCGYLAMLGSRGRAAATYAELSQRYDAAALDRLHVPAGLDLGGQAPAEIALSVIAEIVAFGYGRPGGAMRG